LCQVFRFAVFSMGPPSVQEKQFKELIPSVGTIGRIL
jgi:hypothetical protein